MSTGGINALRRASLLKVEAVLRLALANPSDRVSLGSDPEAFVKQGGILLTEQELTALRDVVLGTEELFFNGPPKGALFDKMKLLREMWAEFAA